MSDHSYCTWGFEAKDSVPKSSHLTPTQRSYQSSAITMIPAVTSVWQGDTANREPRALHCLKNKPKSSLLQGSSGLSHCLFIFLDSCSCLIKYFFSWFINSQQHWTQSHSKVMLVWTKHKTCLDDHTRIMLLCYWESVGKNTLQALSG